MNARLARLADVLGIALDYHDIWGNARSVSEPGLRSLLAAMHVDASSDDAVDRELARIESERAAEAVPPVAVVRVGEPVVLALRLPADRRGATLVARIVEEGGRHHQQAFVPAGLAHVRADDGAPLALALDAKLPEGYHELAIVDREAAGDRGDDGVLGRTLLAIVPQRCHEPAAIGDDRRVWGCAVQLYGVRSQRNWGIGDLTDLATIVDQWGERGAAVVGVNPLHALFPHNPQHVSPYSPGSRLFQNVLYLDVEAIPEYLDCDEARALVRSPDFQRALAALRDADLVDYPAVAERKFAVLERLYAHFRSHDLAAGGERAREFRAFCDAGGVALARHARYEALQEHFHRQDRSLYGWPVWPEAFRRPDSDAVERFAEEHADRVDWFRWLQWHADRQLGTAAARAHDAGLGIGLYIDVAVSIDRAGAEAWANQDVYAMQASVGAPPDQFNMKGQDWGLPAFIPDALRRARYAPFIATLRACMRHAGALRIDHVMGLMRLFWVPAGESPENGAYVHYPFRDLAGLLALESRRHRCLVIGEDLGTVPDEVRRILHDAGVLSYRVLMFERRDGGEFIPPRDYPSQAIVAASTHDLPTLAGWWEGRDVAVREELGLFPPEARNDNIVARAQDRARLLLALEREGLLPEGMPVDPLAMPKMTPAFCEAVHAFLARTPSKVLVTQLEDVLGVTEQVNMPATTDAHPNWRRRLPLALESWPADPRFTGITDTLRRIRGSGTEHRARQPSEAVIPRCTYRLQLHREFTFRDATAIVPYLAALGVSHVYGSPYLRARPGSRHGYDTVAHGELNPEIGTPEDLEAFAQALDAHGMSQVIDVVPNHMGVMGADNAWWMDVLENGPASAYADWFDIDWQPPEPDLAGQVLVPVLGDHYGTVLEKGELTLGFEPASGTFAVRYYDHRFPIDPRDYADILERAHRLGVEAMPRETALDIESLIAAFRHLPTREAASEEARAERERDKEWLKSRLARRVQDAPTLAAAIEQAVREYNGRAGEAGSFDALHGLIERQAWHPAYWRVASDQINYRRFFDVNDLAALRMENDAVFEATHGLVLDLAARGLVQGFRIDHPDGLYDPARYFERLQYRFAARAGLPAPTSPDAKPLYVVVEKIEAMHERLPAEWRVHGTTGYRFANLLTGLFVDTESETRIERAWRAAFPEAPADFEEAAYEGRMLIVQNALASELTVLANRLRRIARNDRHTRDLTLRTLRHALAEVAARFPVYRTYVADAVSDQDRRWIDWAVGHAKRRSRTSDPSVFDFVARVLLLEPPADAPPGTLDDYRAFAMRFQQFTAPVNAKGVEDTAFYLFNRLVSLNEVGGDPGRYGTSVKAFHHANAERCAQWPHSMLAASTHDNKRSADVRARIDLVSEMPSRWRLLTRRWMRMNRHRKRAQDDGPAPSSNDEYLLYQTIVGSLPPDPLDGDVAKAYAERLRAYMRKAVREAKVRTSWVRIDADYEAALDAFIDALLQEPGGQTFRDDLAALREPFAWFGLLNSLSMAALHFTAPGVPDLYQGDELIDLSLVDPDNRRPVDYARRRAALESLQAIVAEPAEHWPTRLRTLVDAPYDGRLKLWVIFRALALRRERPQLFAKGDYTALAVEGARASHAVAFARHAPQGTAVTVAGRLYLSMGLPAGTWPAGETAWEGTTVELPALPEGRGWRNVLTGERWPARATLPLADVLATMPVALLVDERSR